MGFGETVRKKSGPKPLGDRAMTAAERNKKKRTADAELDIPVCANPARRDACSEDLLQFLYTYKPRSIPYSADHIRVIKRMETAVLQGGMYVLACWRSFGKTMISEDCAEWATLYRHKRFVLLIGATEAAAKEMADSIRTDLETNELLYADFPEICHPIRAMEGRPQRAASQTFKGACLHAAAKAGAIHFPLIYGDADRPAACGQIIKTLGLTGRLRGLKHKVPDGKEIRPDLAIPDDPQTDESAGSVEQCDARERLLSRAVSASGGPGAVLSVIMPCTVIANNDLSSRFLDGKRHPEYMHEKCGLVVKWPDAQDTLWRKYAQLRAEDIDRGDPTGEHATEFYRENRAAMDAGAVVSWPEWVEKGELSGVQRVENLLIRYGEDGFAAECMNAPKKEGSASLPYTLTWEHVAMHYLPGRRFLELPAAAKTVTLATDLNEYGLHSVCAGFANDLTGWVPWYNRADNDGHGIVDPGIPEPEAKRQMFEALVKLGKEVAALAIATEGASTLSRPSLWLIDAGYMGDVVRRYLEGPGRTIGVQVMAARGFNHAKYKPYGVQIIGRPREQCHLSEAVVVGRFIAFNTCFWREVSQKAWLSSPDAPGSLSLYQPSAGHHHRDFAEQVTVERLLSKKPHEVTGQPQWEYAKPFARHDYGDALTMCYVAAAWGGIGTGGEARPPARIVSRPRTGTPSRVSSVELED